MASFDFDGIRIDIDPVTLRERVSDPAALARWCAAHPDDPRTVAALRMLERLDEAEALGSARLRDPGTHPVAVALRRTRYAHVLQSCGRFEEAEAEYARAAEETGESDDPTSPSSILALATVLQHRAKNRFEHAGVAEAANRPCLAARLRTSAMEDAERALSIRQALGAPAELIASSEEVVARLAAHRPGEETRPWA